MPCRFPVLCAFVVFVSLGCGRTPAPQPEPEAEPDPALALAMQEATASCQTVVKTVERVQDGNSAEKAIATLRTELLKVRKIRDQIPANLPARSTLSPETIEFLEMMSRLLDAESALIDAVRDRRLAVPSDQLLLELRRYTDELQAIRERIVPPTNSP